MKMKREHYDELQAMIVATLDDYCASKGATPASIRQDYRNGGNGIAHSDQRCGWDMLWLTRFKGRDKWFQRNRIYHYLNDDHISTALRKIVSEAA